MWRLAGRYGMIGVQMVSSVAIGCGGGYWLDRWLGTEPYLFWFGLAAGVGAAVQAVVRIAKQGQKDARR